MSLMQQVGDLAQRVRKLSSKLGDKLAGKDAKPAAEAFAAQNLPSPSTVSFSSASTCSVPPLDALPKVVPAHAGAVPPPVRLTLVCGRPSALTRIVPQPGVRILDWKSLQDAAKIPFPSMDSPGLAPPPWHHDNRSGAVFEPASGRPSLDDSAPRHGALTPDNPYRCVVTSVCVECVLNGLPQT